MKEQYIRKTLDTLLPSIYVNKRNGMAGRVKATKMVAVFSGDDIYFAPEHSGLQACRFIKVSSGCFEVIIGEKLINRINLDEDEVSSVNLHEAFTLTGIKYYE